MPQYLKPLKKLGKWLVSPHGEARPRWVDLLIALGIVMFGMALFLYAYLGIFSRYYADDFCISSAFFTSGFWRSQIGLYTGWSPGFTGTFIQISSEFFGRPAIQIWPALLIVLWILALTWAILQAAKVTRLRVPASLGLLLAEAMVFFTILEAPQQYQAIYWRIGLVAYTLPLVFLAFLVGLIFNRLRKADTLRLSWGGSAACAALAFFAGGISITYVVLQTGLLALAFITVWLLIRPPFRRNSLVLLGGALVGSLVALLVVALAPGNAVRLAAMPPRPQLFSFIRMAVTNSMIFIYISLKDNAFQNLLAVLVPMLITYTLYARDKGLPKLRPSSLILALLLIPIFSSLLVLAVCAPSAYAESSYPEGRVLIEARFITVFMMIAEGALIGMSLSQLHLWAGEPAPFYIQLIMATVFLVVILYPLYDARKSYLEIPFYRQRAVTWDAHDAIIRASLQQGILDVNIKDSQARSFDEFSGLSDLTSDPTNWVNQCAADFYGLHHLTVNAP
jgi:hypothetical protein